MAVTRWHNLEGAELASEVERLVDCLDSDYTARDAQSLYCLSLYEGRSLTSLSPHAYLDEWRRGENVLNINVSRSACDTVQAEIAGRSRPRPMFMTSGADYRMRRRAKRLDKFVESQLRLPQGQYASTHELMEDVLLDALILGTGFAHVYSDNDSIAVDRVPINQIRVDQAEAAAGTPRNWFRRAPIDIDVALEMFGDDEVKRLAIETAPAYDDGSSATTAKVSPPISYTEAWYISPDASSKPGKHVIVIGSTIMVEEDWEHDCAPFVVVRWARERLSWWGKGLVEEGESIAREIDDNAEKLQARFQLCGSKRTYYHEESVNPELLELNEHEVLIPVKPGFQLPVETSPQPVTASEVDWFEASFRRFYELTGVSQMNATSRKESGITAAVAIRTMNDMQSARFSVRARQYEQAFVTLGKLIVQVAREVAGDSKGFKLPWPGNRFHGEIDWKDVDMDDSLYDVQVAPASSLPNTPQGRLSTTQELFQAGVISAPTFKRLLDWPDLEDEMRGETAERERLEWEIDRMLDAEEGEEFEFHPPDGYILDLMGAMVLVGGEYHQAIVEGAPEYNCKLLRAYMGNLDQLIQRQSQPQQGMMPGAPASAPSLQAPLAGAPVPPAAAPNLPVAAQ